MNFVLNVDEIKAKGIPIGELLYLLTLYLDSNITDEGIHHLHHLGYLLKHESTRVPRYEITRGGIELVEQVLLNSEFKGNDITEDRFEKLARQLRKLYPAGRKPGTNYQWRDSNTIIAKKLKALVKKYGDNFTDEEAIAATQKYIESFNGDYRYMQLLKYFISKKKIIDGEIEETSQLLSFIENKDSEDINNDWTVELR